MLHVKNECRKNIFQATCFSVHESEDHSKILRDVLQFTVCHDVSGLWYLFPTARMFSPSRVRVNFSKDYGLNQYNCDPS